MRILIVKTSSMGDVIHTLPAVTDLYHNLILSYKEVYIDWVVEDSFVDIVKQHQFIHKIIPVKLRTWRKNIFKRNTFLEIKDFLNKLRAEEYDYIIDAQGLLKSAVLCWLAKKTRNIGKTHGLDKDSRRGKYISGFYNKLYNINTHLHAIVRVRKLFASIFAYKNDLSKIDYGFHCVNKQKQHQKKYLVFLWCTTWDSKKWPVKYWQHLINLANKHGYIIKLNSGNQQEYHEARELILGLENQAMVELMPPQSISNLMNIIRESDGVISVDTGLGHLAAAFDKPGVGIFGATNFTLTGFISHKFINLTADYSCSPCLLRECDKLNTKDNSDTPPCYDKLTPELVWGRLRDVMSHSVSGIDCNTTTI